MNTEHIGRTLLDNPINTPSLIITLYQAWLSNTP
jgi:hypothetical protein